MRHEKKLGVLAVGVALALALPVLANGPGGRGQGRGGRGGFGGWNPILAGTATAVNATAGTIAVQTGGTTSTSVTLTVPSTLSITRFSTVGLSGLKAGDKVEVQGLPLIIQAKSVRAATPEAATTTGGTTTGTTTGATTGATTGTTTSGATTGTTDHPIRNQADAVAVGTVQTIDTANSQFVVTLADGTSVTVKAAADLQIERQDQVTLAAAVVGDLVYARISTDTAGNVTAVSLQLKAASVAATTTGTATGTTTGATTSATP